MSFVVDDHGAAVSGDSVVVSGYVVDTFVSSAKFVVVHRRRPWFCVDLFINASDCSNVTFPHAFESDVGFCDHHERSRCCQLIRASGALRYRGLTSDAGTNSSRRARG